MRPGRLSQTLPDAIFPTSQQPSCRRKQYIPAQTDPPLFNLIHSRANVEKEGEESKDGRLWEDEYGKMDTEWSVRRMDEIWNASFLEFVKDEENVECIARHLSAVVKDFKISQVANGLHWLIKDWSIESVAKLLRFLFHDWVPDLAGLLCAQLTAGWPLKPDLCLLLAFLLNGETPQVTATFIRCLTSTWNRDLTTKLISYLDTVLEWKDDFFQQFTKAYMIILKEEEAQGKIDEDMPEAILKDLADLYKTNLAVTNMRLLLANARLAAAEQNLVKISHRLDSVNSRSNVNLPSVQSSMPTTEINDEKSTHDDKDSNERELQALLETLGSMVSHSSSSMDSVDARLAELLADGEDVEETGTEDEDEDAFETDDEVLTDNQSETGRNRRDTMSAGPSFGEI